MGSETIQLPSLFYSTWRPQRLPLQDNFFMKCNSLPLVSSTASVAVISSLGIVPASTTSTSFVSVMATVHGWKLAMNEEIVFLEAMPHVK